MRIPAGDNDRLDLYRETLAACLASRQKRIEQYAINRRWYLYGSSSGTSIQPWNKIYSHLDTVTSFLYASDSTRFSTKLLAKAPRSDQPRLGAFTKLVNEEWKDSAADLIFQLGVLWAMIYDSTFVKFIRRGSSCVPFLVDPGSFGVYREDVPMLDRQEAFVHTYYSTRTDLERRLIGHPRQKEIVAGVNAYYQKSDIANAMPPLIDRIVTSQSNPNMIGTVNIDLESPPEYTAELRTELVEMRELYVWNDAEDDYQVVTMASGDGAPEATGDVCVYDRRNFFIPRTKEMEGEHPFVQICPNPLYDYFWGIAEVARLAPLQEKRNQRWEDIQRLLQKQVDPPSAWGGMGITEEKLKAFNSPAAQLAFSDPAFKYEKFIPQIPQDVYADIRAIDDEFNEQSGLTNVLSGKGESGVRSSGHAGKLLTVSSSRPKKRALIIEDSLDKGATIMGKCLYLDETGELEDDNLQKFIPAQMSPHFRVEVDAHSNSPVFMDNQRDNAVILLKAKAIQRDRFIQMMAPPMQEELIRDLKDKIIPGEKAAAQAQQAAIAAGEQAKAAGKGPLKAVS